MFDYSTLLELCRAAKEVRVIPLRAFGGAISLHLEGSVEMLRAAGHLVSIQRVSHELQRGACKMLWIKCEDS